MTDVWCEERYCIHCVVGKCSLDSIGLKMYDRMLSCAQYDDKQSTTNYGYAEGEEEDGKLDWQPIPYPAGDDHDW